MKIVDIQDIIYEKEDSGICTITINQPKRKNAMSVLTFLEIETVLADMEADKNARVLIITGCEEANAFSSGGYFNMGLYSQLPPEIFFTVIIAKNSYHLHFEFTEFFGTNR